MKNACLVLLLASACGANSLAEDPVIDTVAGTGAPKNNGDTGQGHAINIGQPFGVEVGPDGALYVTEVQNHRLRRVDLTTGEISTVAGCGRRGYSGDGDPATEAELNEPYEVRFDRRGNIYFVEMRNHIVRRVDARTNIVTTVAGSGKQGFSGDGGAATSAMLSQPHSIALDASGALYIADIGNHRVRRIDPKTGVIETIAGSAERRMPADGQTARGNPILGPRALCISDNTMWIALREGHSIWRMDLADGILHHVAGTGKPGFAGDGGRAKLAQFNGPKGVAVDRRNRLFVADTENNAIRQIDLTSGIISTIAGSGLQRGGHAGDGDMATNAALNRPHGICVGPNGELYVGDTLNHRVRRVK